MWLSKPPAGIQLNRNHPLAQGLVACWMFNEGSGLRVNDLCGMNPGTLTNFEPFSTTQGWTGGSTVHGTSLRFNPTNSNYVTVVNSPSVDLGAAGTNYSFDAVFYTNDSNVLQMIVGKITGTQVLRLNIEPLNALNTVLYDGVNIPGVITPILSNTYYHAHVNIRRGTSIELYLNGVFIGSAVDTTVGNLQNAVPVDIGRRTDNNSWFMNGVISLVRIWKDRIFPPEEVQQNYAQPYSMFWNPSERIKKNYDNEVLV